MSSLFSNVTEIGGRVDQVQLFLILLMAFWFIACNAVMVYLMLRYRRKSEDQETTPYRGSHFLEAVWTIVPTIIVGIIFVYGVGVWKEMRTPPEDAYTIRVSGQKWSWSYTYPDGRTEARDMYVPQGLPVKLRMQSRDVLHSFFVPEFRVKEDVTPGFPTYLWFQAEKPGAYTIYCTEYCGDDHSAMMGTVHVLSPDDWQKYLNDELFPKLTPLEEGRQLYVKRGCEGCHSIDGAKGIGPSFKGLMGREEVLEDGTVTVDEAYIIDSLKYPDKRLVKGYPAGQMPSFDGQLTDDQMANLITYIKTLK